MVDNGSKDGVASMLHEEFPEVHLIENQINEGFTKPMNQALRLGRGRYLLQLNPDTLIPPDALDNLVKFLDDNPEVGICGPKVLNRDRTMQKPCRRGDRRCCPDHDGLQRNRQSQPSQTEGDRHDSQG